MRCGMIHFMPIAPKPGEGEVCYFARGVDLGCFDNNVPFDDFPLPWDPKDINPGFYLFTRDNRKKEIQMDLNLPIP